MNPKELNVVVTQHAKDRLRQRFFFRFQKYFSHPKITENLIIGQLENAKHLTEWKRVPFYANMMATRHGVETDIFYKSGVFYVCHFNGKHLRVLTVIKKFLYYRTQSVDNQK